MLSLLSHLKFKKRYSTKEFKESTVRDLLGEVGGIEYLTEILDLVPTASNIDHYIKIVQDNAILRNLIETSTEITTLGYESEMGVNETLDEAEKKILSIVKNRRSTEFRNIKIDIIVIGLVHNKISLFLMLFLACPGKNLFSE